MFKKQESEIPEMKVFSLNISKEKGTSKQPVPEIRVTEGGFDGDAHSGRWHRQVSLLSKERMDEFGRKMGKTIAPGAFGENITAEGMAPEQVALLDVFKIGDVELEVTQLGKKCHGEGCVIFQETGACIMPRDGIFCRVVRGGVIRRGDGIVYCPWALRILVITLSDRAFSGEYEDKGGPKIRENLEAFFQDKRWHIQIDTQLLPDDEALLTKELKTARELGIDAVFTTGGTGVGPRDITPDVAGALCDKLIPGIMENIRIKYGTCNPNACLSRSIAGVMKGTVVYTLPGSIRAVDEYMEEILKTMEHLILMIHGLGH